MAILTASSWCEAAHPDITEHVMKHHPEQFLFLEANFYSMDALTLANTGIIQPSNMLITCLQGVETAGQLTDEFQDVARAARTLGMLPPDGIGPVSIGLGKLAARLKVRRPFCPTISALST